MTRGTYSKCRHSSFPGSSRVRVLPPPTIVARPVLLCFLNVYCPLLVREPHINIRTLLLAQQHHHQHPAIVNNSTPLPCVSIVVSVTCKTHTCLECEQEQGDSGLHDLSAFCRVPCSRDSPFVPSAPCKCLFLSRLRNPVAPYTHTLLPTGVNACLQGQNQVQDGLFRRIRLRHAR